MTLTGLIFFGTQLNCDGQYNLQQIMTDHPRLFSKCFFFLIILNVTNSQVYKQSVNTDFITSEFSRCTVLANGTLRRSLVFSGWNT
jgi:hypothetical protein